MCFASGNRDYNERRPRCALNHVTQAEFATRYREKRRSDNLNLDLASPASALLRGHLSSSPHSMKGGRDGTVCIRWNVELRDVARRR